MSVCVCVCVCVHVWLGACVCGLHSGKLCIEHIPGDTTPCCLYVNILWERILLMVSVDGGAGWLLIMCVCASPSTAGKH